MNQVTSIFAALLVVQSGAFAQPDPPKPPKPPKVSMVVAHSPSWGFLGVGVTDVDAERAKALNLKEERGVEVKSVDEDSPAAKAGVKIGDVVLEYNGQRVEGNEQFVRMVHETPVGRQVKLLVWRSGATQTLTATTGSRSGNGFMWNSGDLEIQIPQVHVPDMPHPMVSWQSRTLGVESEALNSQLAEFFGVKEGVLVRSVAKGSAAEKAGLKAGDVITKIGGQKVSSPREIANALRALTSTKAIPVAIVRDRKESTVSVTIEEKASEQIRERVARMDL